MSGLMPVAQIIADYGDEDKPIEGTIVFMTEKEREINLANLADLRAQQQHSAVA